jgi:hypothetical protein
MKREERKEKIRMFDLRTVLVRGDWRKGAGTHCRCGNGDDLFFLGVILLLAGAQ